jgi:hypothetical protein
VAQITLEVLGLLMLYQNLLIVKFPVAIEAKNFRFFLLYCLCSPLSAHSVSYCRAKRA